MASIIQLDRQGWDSDRCGLTLELTAFSTAGFHLHRLSIPVPNVKMSMSLEVFGFGDICTISCAPILTAHHVKSGMEFSMYGVMMLFKMFQILKYLEILD